MVKVMSFNIRYGLADDGDNRWDNRKSLALARIQAFEPDLLGLQECRDDAQAEFIKNSLPAYEFYGVHRGGEGDTALEMAPLLFRKASFQLIRTGCFWLSETPQSAGSKSWDSAFARTAAWAELIHRPSGKALVFLNTHFDYQPAAVYESAQILQRWTQPAMLSRPLIVTGDFNADKASAAYRLLTSQGALFDAYRQIHPGQENAATFHGFGQPEALAPIDWILASGHFRIVDAAIDRTHNGNVYPSDHYPITAGLTWKA
jgi:endonuclease/exonuclease/phosphatase family metal-dependent hydrolase